MQSAQDDCERIQQHALTILQHLPLSSSAPPAESALSASQRVHAAADSPEVVEPMCSLQIPAVHPVSDSPRDSASPSTWAPQLANAEAGSLTTPNSSQTRRVEQAGAAAQAAVATASLTGGEQSATPHSEHVGNSICLPSHAGDSSVAASRDSLSSCRRATFDGKASPLTEHPTVHSTYSLVPAAMDHTDQGHVVDCTWKSDSSGMSPGEAAQGIDLGGPSSPGSGRANIGASWNEQAGHESDDGPTWSAPGSCTDRRISFAPVLDFSARSSRQVCCCAGGVGGSERHVACGAVLLCRHVRPLRRGTLALLGYLVSGVSTEIVI